MAIGVVGAAIAPAVLFADRHSWSPDQRDFARTSSFALWGGLLSAETLLWMLSAYPLWLTFRVHLRNRGANLRSEVLPSALALVAIMVMLVIGPRLFWGVSPAFVPHLPVKIDVLTALALSTALLAAMSIWLIRGRAETLAGRESYSRRGVEEYLSLRRDLDLLLVYLGTVIGLAVLASAALRHLILVYDQSQGKSGNEAPELVVAYGLTLSLILALVYLPTLLTVRASGEQIRDTIQAMPEPSDDDLEKKLSKRDTLAKLLHLDISATTAFRAGVAILTPLLTSLTSLIPKLGG